MLLQIYAYTSSAIQTQILGQFCHTDCLLPNLYVGTLTRESVHRALAQGLTAQQIISFLQQHAHPHVAKRVPVVPEVSSCLQQCALSCLHHLTYAVLTGGKGCPEISSSALHRCTCHVAAHSSECNGGDASQQKLCCQGHRVCCQLWQLDTYVCLHTLSATTNAHMSLPIVHSSPLLLSCHTHSLARLSFQHATHALSFTVTPHAFAALLQVVADQIRLWEAETQRVRTEGGYMYAEFETQELYTASKDFAAQMGVLLWESSGTSVHKMYAVTSEGGWQGALEA